MSQVSEAHEERPIREEFYDFRNMSTKWTFPTSLLYVLTVLTTWYCPTPLPCPDARVTMGWA